MVLAVVAVILAAVISPQLAAVLAVTAIAVGFWFFWQRTKVWRAGWPIAVSRGFSVVVLGLAGFFGLVAVVGSLQALGVIERTEEIAATSPSEIATAEASPSPTPSPTATPSPPPTPTPVPTPTPIPTPTPTSTPVPTPEPASFGDGTYLVGSEIEPGTYRTPTATSFCYWARLSGFSGELDDIISNSLSSGYQVVTIAADDAGFESEDCGLWTQDLSAVREDPAAPLDEGTYIVGVDAAPGTWRSGPGDGCYAARLSGFGGTLGEVLSNDLGSGLVMTVAPTDRGFTVTGCDPWTYLSP